MRRKKFQVGILWRLVIALILALCLVPISSNPVFAQSIEDYFTYSYDVEFSSTEIEGSEVFYATITVDANCTNDLPLSPSEASITGRIIAEHQTSGAEVTLNSNYTVTVDGLSGTFTVKAEGALIPLPAISVKWGIIGSIIAGCIIVGLLIYFFVWRKRGEPQPS